MKTSIGLVFSLFLLACGPEPLELEQGSCEPFGFSCVGADEWESDQLSLECDAIGGYCAASDEPRPAACPPPAFQGPTCLPR